MPSSKRSNRKSGTGVPYGRHAASSELIYSDAELEILKAVDKEKRRLKQLTLTMAQFHRLIWSMGYRPVDEPKI